MGCAMAIPHLVLKQDPGPRLVARTRNRDPDIKGEKSPCCTWPGLVYPHRHPPPHRELYSYRCTTHRFSMIGTNAESHGFTSFRVSDSSNSPSFLIQSRPLPFGTERLVSYSCTAPQKEGRLLRARKLRFCGAAHDRSKRGDNEQGKLTRRSRSHSGLPETLFQSIGGAADGSTTRPTTARHHPRAELSAQYPARLRTWSDQRPSVRCHDCSRFRPQACKEGAVVGDSPQYSWEVVCTQQNQERRQRCRPQAEAACIMGRRIGQHHCTRSSSCGGIWRIAHAHYTHPKLYSALVRPPTSTFDEGFRNGGRVDLQR